MKTKNFIAVSSFFAAVVLAFTSVIISPGHDVASGVLMMCAQFLVLCATILGIDYQILRIIGRAKKI